MFEDIPCGTYLVKIVPNDPSYNVKIDVIEVTSDTEELFGLEERERFWP